MKRVIQYEHHGKKVWVMQKNKGKHRDSCLCYQCKFLNLKDPIKNCQVAKIVYSMCESFNMVLPVWECPQYKPKDKKDGE